MPRSKNGTSTHRRHHRILKAARGYFLGRGKLWRTAVIQVRRAWAAAFRGRKQRKRDMRSLWITRINAGGRDYGLSYSYMIHGLKNAGVNVNRKVLADMAVRDSAAFAELAELAKASL